MIGLLWFEHNYSSTQMRRLTNLALTRFILLFSQRISDSNGCGLLNQISFKLIALNHSANSLFFLIPQRIEHWTYSYQKYTLPIKLRNLIRGIIYFFFKSIQIWTENLKFEAFYFTIKLYSFLRKRDDSNIHMLIHNI